MSESMMKEPISRRTFLKLAAGSAAGALLFHFPFQASAAEETAKTLEIRPCSLSALPAAEESAKNSPLVKDSFMPTAAEVSWAHRVIEADKASKGGAVKVDGRMIDRPVVLLAQRTLAVAGKP